MAWFRRRSFESAAQIVRVTDGNLINPAKNDNQTGKHFAKAAEIID